VTGVAEFWDREYADADSWPIRKSVSERTRATAARLRALGAVSVLDLGCGVGRFAIFLGKSGFNVVGADISAVGIARARTWARQERVEIGFCIADAVRLPFKDRSFDAVVANSVLDHMSLGQAKEAGGEIRRVLSDSGLVCASFDHLEEDPEDGDYDTLEDGSRVYTSGPQTGMIWRFFSEDEMESLFSDFGSKKIETVESGSRQLWATKRPGDIRLPKGQ
jgi:ubiquinone/menaquinone biosynthesis C-methylase UbiE